MRSQEIASVGQANEYKMQEWIALTIPKEGIYGQMISNSYKICIAALLIIGIPSCGEENVSVMDSTIIVPGERLGEMKLSEVNLDDEKLANMEGVVFLPPDDDGRMAIAINSSRFKTTNGIRVGDSLRRVQQRYGSGEFLTDSKIGGKLLVYADDKISFGIERGHVVSIFIEGKVKEKKFGKRPKNR